MNINVASFVLGAIQTLVIIISAFLFLYQLKQFNHNLYQDAYTKLADYSMQINGLLLDNTSIANQFYQRNMDYRNLDDGQKDLYNYLALMLGLYEHLYILLQAKRIDQKIWAAWERWLVQVIIPLDIFPIVWENERTMYHEDFYKYVDAKFDEYKVLVSPTRSENSVS